MVRPNYVASIFLPSRSNFVVQFDVSLSSGSQILTHYLQVFCYYLSIYLFIYLFIHFYTCIVNYHQTLFIVNLYFSLPQHFVDLPPSINTSSKKLDIYELYIHVEYIICTRQLYVEYTQKPF